MNKIVDLALLSSVATVPFSTPVEASAKTSVPAVEQRAGLDRSLTKDASQMQHVLKIQNHFSMQSSWDHCETFLKTITDNDPLVMKNYRTFAANLQSAFEEGLITQEGVEKILKGIEFSAEKHKSQKRKSPPYPYYISHPIGVANNVLEIGKVTDPDILIGALLHDTVEDTHTNFEEIRFLFGETVEGYVREVTDDKSLPKAERKRLQIEHASHKSEGAALIKLSDKLYNLNDMMLHAPEEDGKPWPKERLNEYFSWATQVVDNLPKVNDDLKAAVDRTIERYWR